MKQREIGIIGLGPMGQNLALNIAEKGFGVAAFDPWDQACGAFRTKLQGELDGKVSDMSYNFV